MRTTHIKAVRPPDKAPFSTFCATLMLETSLAGTNALYMDYSVLDLAVIRGTMRHNIPCGDILLVMKKSYNWEQRWNLQ